MTIPSGSRPSSGQQFKQEDVDPEQTVETLPAQPLHEDEPVAGLTKISHRSSSNVTESLKNNKVVESKQSALLDINLSFLDNTYVAALQNREGNAIHNITEHLFLAEEVTIDTERPSTQYLLAMMDFVKEMDAQKILPYASLHALVDYIEMLFNISQGVLPEKAISLKEVAELCGVEVSFNPMNEQIDLDGAGCLVSFFGLAREWLRRTQGVFEVYSKEFVRELADCLQVIDKPLVEIAAGRGMLSAGLIEAGAEVILISDIHPDQPHWPGVKVNALSALEVIKKYHNSVIYLTGQPSVEMFDDLERINAPCMMLQTGCRYDKRLSEFEKKGMLRIFPLHMPSYTIQYPSDDIRLLFFCFPEKQRKEVMSKIPEKYRGHQE